MHSLVQRLEVALAQEREHKRFLLKAKRKGKEQKMKF
jgi:hypothetical protein